MQTSAQEFLFKFKKARYSEWVIRNALYWLTAHCQWALNEDESDWIVSTDREVGGIKFELDRLLNDYLLRETMMKKTGDIRDSIAANVLQNIQKRVTK